MGGIMEYVPDNYDMFLRYEAEYEKLRKSEQEEWGEVYGSGKDYCMEDRDTDFD